MARIDFANSLRGIASICVLIAHYVVMVHYNNAAYSGLPALPGPIYPQWLVQALTAYEFNLGVFGVGLFFLISGLVIPNSIASLPDSLNGRVAFVMARALRLWPTYAVGLLVVVGALCVALTTSGYAPDFTVRDVLVNTTFFRDWTTVPVIGGIVWTLEVEAKFYLFVLIFWTPLSKGRLWPLFLALAVMLAVAPFKAEVPMVWAPPQNFLWFFKYLGFMVAGIAFNFHHRGLITTEKLFGVTLACMTAFAFALSKERFAIESLASYLGAFAVFAGMYLFARGWTGGPVIRFLADISYPLYAMHAAFGYTGLRLMMGAGVAPLIALVLQTTLTLLVAYAIHRLIEVPTHRLGKALSKGIGGAHPSPGVAAT